MNAFGGYRVQGRGEDGEALLRDAKSLQAAGAFAVVLEVVPAQLASQVTASLAIPVIGIGAGPDCDAQVLVWQDMAGLTPQVAKFVKKYADVARQPPVRGPVLRRRGRRGAVPRAGARLPLSSADALTPRRVRRRADPAVA